MIVLTTSTGTRFRSSHTRSNAIISIEQLDYRIRVVGTMVDNSCFAVTSHLLVLFLAVVLPVWDVFETRRLKARRDDAGAKVRSYAKTMAVLWLAALCAWAISGARIFQTPSLRAALPFLTRGAGPQIAAGLVLGAAIGLLVLPLAASRSAALRAKLARPYARLDFFLPTRPAEFLLFPMVCVTAGVCEEVLFRAFLLSYFSQSGFRFGAWAAIAAASVVFGIAHFYQGFAGVILTAALGFGLAMLYLWTGGLAAPMVLHALIDLRAWLVLWLNRGAAAVHPAGAGPVTPL